MSNDDGYGSRSSDEDFAAFFNAATDERGMSLPQVCQRANVSIGEATRVIQQGTYGLPQNLPILMRLTAVLRVDISSLLSCPITPEGERRESLSMTVKKLVWEYVFKSGVSSEQGSRLVEFVKRLLASLPNTSLQAAHRAGVPTNWKDVARLHKRMLEQDKGQ